MELNNSGNEIKNSSQIVKKTQLKIESGYKTSVHSEEEREERKSCPQGPDPLGLP